MSLPTSPLSEEFRDYDVILLAGSEVYEPKVCEVIFLRYRTFHCSLFGPFAATSSCLIKVILEQGCVVGEECLLEFRLKLLPFLFQFGGSIPFVF